MSVGVSFGGVSNDDLGLIYISDTRTILTDATRYTVQIPGLHGDVDFGMDTYAVKPLDVVLRSVWSDADLRTQQSRIAQWIYTAGQYRDLIFADQPDRKYRAKVISKLDCPMDVGFTDFTISFIANPPFVYLLSNLPITPEDAAARAAWDTAALDDLGLQYIQTFAADGDMRFTVGGHLPVACTIKLIGYIPSGLTLTYNGQTWKYNQLLAYDGIRNDSDAETSWRMSDDANLYDNVDYLNGKDDYFILQPGQQTIHVAGVAGMWPQNLTVCVEFAPMEAA